MRKQKKYTKCHMANLLKICIMLFLVASLFITFVSATSNEACKITVTNRGDSQVFGGSFQSNPLSLDIINEISDIDHIKEIIPIITKTYGFEQGNVSGNPINHDEFNGEPPDWNKVPGNAPPAWNGSQSDGIINGRMQEMVDFIIEGISLEYIHSYQCYELPGEMESGRMLNENDLSVVYIGEDAQKYFNKSVGEEIQVNDMNFTVVGIFSNDTYNKYIFMNATDARILLNLGNSEVNGLYVYVDDADYLNDVSSTIQERFSYLMTRYMGGSNMMRPPGDNFQFPLGETAHNPTPGFEIVIALCALTVFFIYTKSKKKAG